MELIIYILLAGLFYYPLYTVINFAIEKREVLDYRGEFIRDEIKVTHYILYVLAPVVFPLSICVALGFFGTRYVKERFGKSEGIAPRETVVHRPFVSVGAVKWGNDLVVDED